MANQGATDWMRSASVIRTIYLSLAVIAVACLVTIAIFQVRNSAPAAGTQAGPIPTFGASFTAPPRVTFIGDSYTAGHGATKSSRGFVTVLSNAEGWTTKTVACGGGGYSNPGNCHLPYADNVKAFVANRPQKIFVTGGGNDRRYPPAEVEKDAQRLFQELKAADPTASIFAISPVWGNASLPSSLAAVQGAVKSAAAKENVTYVDIGEPIMGKPNLIASDGYHPNDAGHAVLAKAIQEALH